MPPKRSRKAAAGSRPTANEAPTRPSPQRQLGSVSEGTLDIDDEEISSMTSPAARKRKRNDDQDALREAELKEQRLWTGKGHDKIADQQQPAAQPTNAQADRGSDQASPERHVHFDDAHDPEQRKGSLLKLQIKRRKTTSPHDGHHKQRLRVAVARASLPDQNSVRNHDVLDEPIRYTPLREMIDQRKEFKRNQRLHRDDGSSSGSDGSRAVTRDDEADVWIQMAKDEERVRNLLNELASGRHDEDSVSGMTAELKALEQKLATSTALHISDRVSDDLLIADVQHSSASDVGSDVLTTSDGHDDFEREPELTDVSRSTRYWDSERTKLQDAVLALSQQVNDIKERWRIHEISLQSLGFAAEDESGDETIAAMRDAFDHLRTAVSRIYPDDDLSVASNAELMEAAISTLGTLSIDSSLLTRQLADRNKLTSELRVQIDGLIERIADAENELERVKKQRTVLLQQAESYDSGTLKTAFEVAELKREKSSVEEQLSKAAGELDQARSYINQLQLSAERHKTSLQGYRKEEDRLLKLIERMEQDHNDKVASMETLLQSAELHLDAEKSASAQAETSLKTTQADVVQLDNELSTVAKERDAVFDKLKNLDEELQSERSRREQLEASEQVHSSETEQLQARVEALEAQLLEIQDTTHSVREQRLSAEAKLVNIRDHAAELQDRLEASEAETNSMRKSLADSRTAHELESQASADIERHHQQRIAALEQESTTLRRTIDELQSELQTHHEEADRSSASHEADIARRDALTATSRRVLDEILDEIGIHHAAHLSALDVPDEDNVNLTPRIDVLQQALRELHGQTAQELWSANAEIEAQLDEIEKHKHENEEYQSRISDLEKRNFSLEQRVEGEAEQMLQTQAEKLDELDELRAALLDKQNKMLVVQAKAHETDQRWQELLHDREHELDRAQATIAQQQSVISRLDEQLQLQQDTHAEHFHNAEANMRDIASALWPAETIIRRVRQALDASDETELNRIRFLARENNRFGDIADIRSMKGRRQYDSGFGADLDATSEEDPIAI